MKPPTDPPRRRNAQVRTYWRLMQHAIQHGEISGTEAHAVYRLLQQANARLRVSTFDKLEDLNPAQLVAAAHHLLGFGPSSLLKSVNTDSELTP